MSEKKTIFEYLSYLAIAVSVILILFGVDIFKNSWGLSGLHYLPSYVLYVWVGLIVLSLIPLVLKKSIWPFSILEKHLWRPEYSKIQWTWLGLIIVIFWLLRIQGHFWGNGYINLGNFARHDVTIFRWYEYGGTLVPWFIYKFFVLIGISKMAAALWGYRLISSASGAVYIICAHRLARLLSDDDRTRTGFLWLVVFGGQLLFFMGMLENYTLLPAIFMVQTVLTVKRHISGSTNDLLKLWLVTTIGVFADFMFICTLPAVMYSTFSPGRKDQPRPGKIGLITGLLTIVIGLVLVYWKSSTDIFVESRLLHVSVNPATPYYSLIGMKNLSEKLNAIFFIVPLVPLFGLAIVMSLKKFSQFRQTTYFILVTLSQLLVIFIANPYNGTAREIPFYGFLSLGLVLWGSYALVSAGAYIKIGLAGRLPLIALVMAVPVIWLWHAPESGVAFLKNYFEHNQTKYEPALGAFRDYYFVRGNYARANEEEQSIRGSAPGRLESDLISDLYYHERYTDALEYADRLVERYPYQGKYRIQRGNILEYFKRFTEAENEFKTAIKLNPDDMTAYHFLSELYRQNKLEHKCIEVLDRAQAIAPGDSLIVIDLIGYYYRMRDFRKTDSLTDMILKEHPGEPYGHMYKGLLLEQTKQPDRAVDQYLAFIWLNKDLPEVEIIRKRLEKMAPQRLDSLDVAIKGKYYKVGGTAPAVPATPTQ